MFIWVAAIASNIMAFFAAMLAKKAAVGSAAVGGGIALMLSLSAAINILLSGIVRVLPEPLQLGAMMVPDNAGLCLAAIMSALGSRWAYNFAQKSIDRISAA